MATNQIRGLAHLLSHTARRTADEAEHVHRAITGRVFPRLPPFAAPVRALHDPIATTSYRATRVLSRAVGTVVGATAGALGGDRDVRIFERTRPGTSALGALNGLFGDSYERDHPDLDLAMGLRHHDAPLDLAPESLASTFAGTRRLAVFVHGLASTDQHWFGRAPADGPPPEPSYGDRLEADLGLTALYVRYNTGRHVSDNGRRLSDLLGALVACWPGPVDDLVLVGHSMGGMVVRAACVHAAATGAPWLAPVHDIVLLGSPLRGSGLERLANSAAAATVSSTFGRPAGRVLRARSAGIKDLRWGYTSPEHWQGRNPDELHRDEFDHPDLPAGVRVHHVAASLTAEPDHPVARRFGDLLVTPRSALDRPADAPLDPSLRHVGRTNHLKLLRSPEVYEHLHEVLAAHRPETPR